MESFDTRSLDGAGTKMKILWHEVIDWSFWHCQRHHCCLYWPTSAGGSCVSFDWRNCRARHLPADGLQSIKMAYGWCQNTCHGMCNISTTETALPALLVSASADRKRWTKSPAKIDSGGTHSQSVQLAVRYPLAVVFSSRWFPLCLMDAPISGRSRCQSAQRKGALLSSAGLFPHFR